MKHPLQRIVLLATLVLAFPAITFCQPRIISPNGGETWWPGSRAPIQWSGTDSAEAVRLEYSTDQGTSWKPISSAAAGGEFIWQVPNDPSGRCLVRVVQGSSATILRGHSTMLADAAFGDNGRLISAFGYGAITVWDAASRAVLWQRAGSWAKPNPRHDILARVEDGYIILHTMSTGAVIDTLKGHTGFINSVRFTPDGTMLVSASDDSTAIIWNGVTGARLHVLRGYRSGIGYIRFSGDSRRMVVTDRKGGIRIWDLASGALLRTITSGTGSFNSASLDGTGEQVTATRLYDTLVNVWNVSTGNVIHSLRGGGFTVFAPVGSRLAVGNASAGVLLYDAATGNLLHELDHQGEMSFLASFSVDAGRLATLDAQGGVKVWNAETGELEANLIGHQFDNSSLHGVVASVEFSDHGTHVLTAGADKTARFWSLDAVDVVSDVSDNPFTIWPATLSTSEINMGTAPYGFRRDTTVVALFRNPESKPVRIGNFRITGPDSASFALLPDDSPLEIPAGGSAALTIRFTPAAARYHQAIVSMQADDEELQVSVRGEGIALPLVQLADLADLGRVDIADEKDTVTGPIMRNMSGRSLTIDTVLIGGGYRVLSPSKDTVLSPEGTLSIRVIYYAGTVARRDPRFMRIVYRHVDGIDTLAIPIDIETVAPSSVARGQDGAGAIKLYPNPSFDRLRMTLASEGERTCRITIYDLSGAKLLQRIQQDELGADGSIDLDVASLPEGAYLLVVESGSRRNSGILHIVR